MPRKPRATPAGAPSATVLLTLDDVVIDLEIQPRVFLDEKVIDRYAELYLAVKGTEAEPDILPPLAVMMVDGERMLIDGFHRHAAAERAERTRLRCVVSTGTRQDAIREAALANVKHGLPYTPQDKERVLERLLDDPVYSAKSTREIGIELNVSHQTVHRFKERRQAVKAITQAAPDVVTLAREAGIVDEGQLAVLAQVPLHVPALVEQAVKRVVHDPGRGTQETVVPEALARLKEDLFWRAKMATAEQEVRAAANAKRQAARTPEARAAKQAEKETRAAQEEATWERHQRNERAWQIDSLVHYLANMAAHEANGTWPAGRSLEGDVAAVHQGDQRRLVGTMAQAVTGLALLVETCEAAGWNVQRVRDAVQALQERTRTTGTTREAKKQALGGTRRP